MKRWQSYSTPVLVDGITMPIRPREPIQGSCGLVSSTIGSFNIPPEISQKAICAQYYKKIV